MCFAIFVPLCGSIFEETAAQFSDSSFDSSDIAASSSTSDLSVPVSSS
jgi:hypothetical protein